MSARLYVEMTTLTASIARSRSSACALVDIRVPFLVRAREAERFDARQHRVGAGAPEEAFVHFHHQHLDAIAQKVALVPEELGLAAFDVADERALLEAER